MKIVAQRVKKASVSVNGEVISDIAVGLLLLVGVGKDDGIEDMQYLSRKIANLRIFNDDNAMMNLNVKQANGKILSVSQCTLFAETKRGNRPGFSSSAPAEIAKKCWIEFNDMLRTEGLDVHEGVFGADMKVALVND